MLAVMEEHRKAAGQRLVKLREAAGLNQEELASNAKLSVKTVSRFENGRHDGRRTTVRALANALNVSESDILGPPPSPLGLDAAPTQMDRIETMLRAVCDALHLDVDVLLTTPPDEQLAAGLEEEADQLDEQRPDSEGEPGDTEETG